MIQVEGCFENIMLDVVTGSSKPAAVEQDQIFVITDTIPDEIYVSAVKPTSPFSGDIWVVLGDSACRFNLSDTFDVGLSAVRQYNGSSWTYLAAYVGREDKWELFGAPVFTRDIAETPQSLNEVGYDGVIGWDYIILLCNSGVDVRDYFCIGDTVTMTLIYEDETSEDVVMAVGTFYHNEISGTNKKASVGFTSEDCLSTKIAMYTATPTDVNWKDCPQRTYLNEDIFNAISFKEHIKPVDVITAIDRKHSSLDCTSDKIRMHSVAELNLYYASSMWLEGSPYEYYTDAASRIKTVNGTASIYYTRSPIDSTSYYRYCTITAAGAANYSNSTVANGIAFTFDI